MWVGFVDISPPICLPDESQEEKLVHDQRCPEVMPSLETWSLVFHWVLLSCCPFFPTTSELLMLQLKERQCHGFPGCSLGKVAAHGALIDFSCFKNRV